MSVCYEIAADAQSDVLLRVAIVLNFANTAPRCFTLRTPNPDEVHIEAILQDISMVLADMICRKLSQLTCTIVVEMRAWP